MRKLRRTVLVLTALALCAAPVSAAQAKQKGGEVVPLPNRVAGLTGGELLGAAWVQFLSEPAGTFSGGCSPVAHKVVAPEPGPDGIASCTVRKGTSLVLVLGSECSDVEEPPFFGEDEAEQRQCAIDADEFFLSALISIDGADPVEHVTPAFERISPQRTVDLPPDNVLGVAPQTATFVAHGWPALIRGLGVGEHEITATLTTLDGVQEITILVNVVKR